MKTKRFDFNFRPLQINVSFSIEGSVPDRQTYDADSGEYTPDYTVTPVIIQPNVSRMDKDEILLPGRINQYLTNIRWYEIIGGVKTLIASDNAGYEITTSGDNAGRIKVKKNAAQNIPITLQFYGEYIDTRTNQLHIVQGTNQIFCDNSTVYMPVLSLNAADTTIYNPLSDADTQTVTASLKLGADECPTDKRLFVWEKWNPNDLAWAIVGAETTLDYDVTVSTDGVSCIVDRSLIGADLYLRCRAKYDINGNPEGVALSDASPCKVISFVRRLPKFEFDYFGVPTNIPADLMAVAPFAKIWNANGDLPSPERELLALWYIATNQASGSLSYNPVAHGMNPTIPTAALSQIYGAVIGLDVIDRGPWASMEDADGVVFEDGSGNLILIH